MTIENYACPHCTAVNETRLMDMASTVGLTTYLNGEANNWCGHATFFAMILVALTGLERMERSGERTAAGTFDEVLPELRRIAHEAVDAEMGRRQ